MTTLLQLQNQIVEAYNEATPAAQMLQIITKYFASQGESKSKIDPQRLGTQSQFISKLRQALLEQVDPWELDNDKKDPEISAFNQMNVKQQLQFQARSIWSGRNKWVHDLDVMPKNIQDLKPSLQDIDALKKLRARIDTGKLRDESREIDGDRMLEKLGPILENPEAKRNQLEPHCFL